jgi:uracil-DNA glycosylase family 4
LKVAGIQAAAPEKNPKTGEFMDSSSRAHTEAWLQYNDDLGLGPFYRDRASNTALVSAREQEQLSGVKSSAVSTAAVPTEMAAARSGRVQASPATSAPKAAPTVLPGIGGTSLFDERIPGDNFQRIRDDIGANCTRCKLHKGRTKIVFGVGNPKAELVFVGEGPGRDEDQQGEPFVGRAGKLLTQMIEAMSLRREDVYICNVVKCRPPENRLPEKDEISTCSPFLMRQLAAIQPKVICCLGSCASQTLLQTNQGISRFRGEWFDFRGSKLIATYHPAYLLRNPAAKGEVWKDLQKVMAVLGLEPRRR